MTRRTHKWSLAAMFLAPMALVACSPSESTSGESTTDPGVKTASETFEAGPFTVPSGEDQTFCTYVRAEGDTEQDISAFLTEQTQGGHHLIVYTIDHAVDLAPHPCSQGGQPSWTQVLATQIESEDIAFPEGVGFRVKAHQQYVMETHFINTTAKPLDVTAKFGVVYAEPGSVKERAATYFFGTMNIDVEPNASATKTAECHPPRDMFVHTMFGHQHRMGTSLDVQHRPGGKGGDGIYHSTDWENPGLTDFGAGMALSTDDVISVTCNWDNTSGDRLRYPHEMCYAIGYYWPADAGLFCATGGGDDATCQCREQGSLDTGPGGAAVEVSLTRKADIANTGGPVDTGAPIYCALFRAEDYGPTGPKPGKQPYYFRDAVDVALKTDTDVAKFDIQDVTPGDYKVSCVMDVIGGGFMPGKGDIANLTAPKVTLKKGDTAHVDVQLNIAIP